MSEPGTAEDARRSAQEAQRESDKYLQAAEEAARAAGALEDEAAADQRTADALAQDAQELIDELELTTFQDAPAAFTGDATAAHRRAAEIRKSLKHAESTAKSTRDAMVGRGHAVSQWAASERFAGVTPEVRDRFRAGADVADLAAEAETLSEHLNVYRRTMAGQLAAADKDKDIVVTALCNEVRESLKTLVRAQNHAQLPPGLGDHLTNRRFLDVGPRSSVDTSASVLRSRVERLVDKIVQRDGLVPDGRTLVWEATSAAVGRGNFTARVLKPSLALADERQPIELMSKWSGGEKVTISLLIFCMLARLRAANRGSNVPGLAAAETGPDRLACSAGLGRPLHRR